MKVLFAAVAAAAAARNGHAWTTSLAKAPSRAQALCSRDRDGVMEPAVYDMVGADVETNGLFDPLHLADDEASLFRRRAVELKHGRVAMLAVVGKVTTDAGFAPLSFPALPVDEKGGWDVAASLEQPGPLLFWGQLLALAGMFELTVGRQDYETREPGELGLIADFVAPAARDSEATRLASALLQLQELKHGRLAMLGITGTLAQEAVCGETTVQRWRRLAGAVGLSDIDGGPSVVGWFSLGDADVVGDFAGVTQAAVVAAADSAVP